MRRIAGIMCATSAAMAMGLCSISVEGEEELGAGTPDDSEEDVAVAGDLPNETVAEVVDTSGLAAPGEVVESDDDAGDDEEDSAED